MQCAFGIAAWRLSLYRFVVGVLALHRPEWRLYDRKTDTLAGHDPASALPAVLALPLAP